MRNYAFLLLMFFPSANAGTDTTLYTEQLDGCKIRIQHSATPDAKTGVIDFRAYRNIKGIQQRCSPPIDAVTSSLAKAIAVYSRSDELKPVESVFIGRLVNYTWIKVFLNRKSSQHRGGKMSAAVFHNMLARSGELGPFEKALQQHGYAKPTVSCEKLLRHESGAVHDAMCWLDVEKQYGHILPDP